MCADLRPRTGERVPMALAHRAWLSSICDEVAGKVNADER
jgi:hypothetical protein